MAYEMVMPYHLHMPSYFLETFTEYPLLSGRLLQSVITDCTVHRNRLYSPLQQTIQSTAEDYKSLPYVKT